MAFKSTFPVTHPKVTISLSDEGSEALGDEEYIESLTPVEVSEGENGYRHSLRSRQLLVRLALAMCTLLAAGCTTILAGKIAFVSEREGRAQLYLMEPDGSNIVRLTDMQLGIELSEIYWSPDGERLIVFARPYQRYSGGYGEHIGRFDMFVVKADGGGITKVATDIVDFAAWSPNGRQIAFETDREVKRWGMKIYVMDVDGSNVRLLTERGRYNCSPAWSPDGERIAFASEEEGVWVINSDGSGERQVTRHAHDSLIGWVSNGERLLISRDNDLYVVSIEGSDVVNLTDSPWSEWDAALCPGGAKVAFKRGYEYGSEQRSELYVMDVDTLAQTLIVSDPSGIVWSPSWSPTCEHVVFAWTREGNTDIYRFDTDGRDLVRLTTHPESDWTPRWSPHP